MEGKNNKYIFTKDGSKAETARSTNVVGDGMYARTPEKIRQWRSMMQFPYNIPPGIAGVTAFKTW